MKHLLASVLTYRKRNQSDPIDLRQHTRGHAGYFRASYFAGGGEGPHTVMDISIGGARIHCVPHWGIGTVMTMVFQAELTDMHAVTMSVPARVVRCTAEDFAVQFIFHDKEGRKEFQHFLNERHIHKPAAQAQLQ